MIEEGFQEFEVRNGFLSHEKQQAQILITNCSRILIMRHFFHQLIIHILTQIELGLLHKILLLVTYRVNRILFTLALCIIFLIDS